MLGHLADVSVRALVLAAIAMAVLWRKRSAAMQHAVWTAVAVGMLGLFVFGAALPRIPVRVLKSEQIPVAQPPAVVSAEARLTPMVSRAPASESRIAFDWSELAVSLYALVAIALLGHLAIGMFLVWRLVRRSTRAGDFYESASIKVPLTVGWLRPKILLPPDWREWSQGKLEAVLAHERAHVRRPDGLMATLAGVNRCIFWFHPLAWWIERRLGLLAELACDEVCVVELGDQRRYANLLLEMARVVDQSRGRLNTQVFNMAASSHMRTRIDSILEEGRTFSRGLSGTAKVAMMLCGAPLVWGAGAVTLDRKAPLLAVVQRSETPTPPLLLAQAQDGRAAPVPVARRLRFESASVERSGPYAPSNLIAIMPQESAKFLGATLTYLISAAHGVQESHVSGPDWIETERFDVIGKLPKGATEDQIPQMLQALLAERFGLAVRRVSEERVVNALVVASGGVKLKAASPSLESPSPASLNSKGRNPEIRLAAMMRKWDLHLVTPVSPNVPSLGAGVETLGARYVRVRAPNATMHGLVELMPKVDGEQVVDLTGLTGRYQVDLTVPSAAAEWRRQAQMAIVEENAAKAGAVVSEDLSAAAILDAWRVALEPVGLGIEQRQVAIPSIVVDRAERPRENR